MEEPIVRAGPAEGHTFLPYRNASPMSNAEAPESTKILNSPSTDSLPENCMENCLQNCMENHSFMSDEIDRWLNSEIGNSTEISSSRIGQASVNHSQATRSSIMSHERGLLYLLALLFSYFGVERHRLYSPSMMLHTANYCLTFAMGTYETLKTNVHNLMNDQFCREMFATAMDVVLVCYAIGFLVLSIYQATN